MIKWLSHCIWVSREEPIFAQMVGRSYNVNMGQIQLLVRLG